MPIFTRFSAEETREHGFTYRLVLSAADVAAMTTAVPVSVFPRFNSAATFPVGTRIRAVISKISISFVGSGALSATVGDSGSATRYLSIVDLKAAAPLYANPALGTDYVAYTAADQLKLVITAATGALSQVTAGELVLLFEIDDLTRASTPIS